MASFRGVLARRVRLMAVTTTGIATVRQEDLEVEGQARATAAVVVVDILVGVKAVAVAGLSILV